MSAGVVKPLDDLFDAAFFFERFPDPPKIERSFGVFGTAMDFALNLLIKDSISEVFKREEPLPGEIEKFDSVNELRLGDSQVDDAEVVVESVTNELASAIDEEAKFEIRSLAGNEPMGAL